MRKQSFGLTVDVLASNVEREKEERVDAEATSPLTRPERRERSVVFHKTWQRCFFPHFNVALLSPEVAAPLDNRGRVSGGHLIGLFCVF